MSSGISVFTVVNLLDDDNQDVCVISEKWLPAYEIHAYIPNVGSGKFQRLMPKNGCAHIPGRAVHCIPVTGLVHLVQIGISPATNNRYPCKVQRPINANLNYCFTRYAM
ncbi:hypothetical protein FGIG_10631 [Fasciola gigantica]|uniref:Uncharacterized protein n=1 Tax=Fasciola gigantica TaxID=46835 RepID=A0A504YX39_FASGI|nr:hypothetical protein FGIG_10631 [Fasciola gigantica]